jgi:hypothetical protein
MAAFILLIQPIRLIVCLTSDQGRTNPGRLVNVETRFWTVATIFLENAYTSVLSVVGRT